MVWIRSWTGTFTATSEENQAGRRSQYQTRKHTSTRKVFGSRYCIFRCSSKIPTPEDKALDIKISAAKAKASAFEKKDEEESARIQETLYHNSQRSRRISIQIPQRSWVKPRKLHEELLHHGSEYEELMLVMSDNPSKSTANPSGQLVRLSFIEQLYKKNQNDRLRKLRQAQVQAQANGKVIPGPQNATVPNAAATTIRQVQQIGTAGAQGTQQQQQPNNVAAAAAAAANARSRVPQDLTRQQQLQLQYQQLQAQYPNLNQAQLLNMLKQQQQADQQNKWRH